MILHSLVSWLISFDHNSRRCSRHFVWYFAFDFLLGFWSIRGAIIDTHFKTTFPNGVWLFHSVIMRVISPINLFPTALLGTLKIFFLHFVISSYTADKVCVRSSRVWLPQIKGCWEMLFSSSRTVIGGSRFSLCCIVQAFSCILHPPTVLHYRSPFATFQLGFAVSFWCWWVFNL